MDPKDAVALAVVALAALFVLPRVLSGTQRRRDREGRQSSGTPSGTTGKPNPAQPDPILGGVVTLAGDVIGQIFGGAQDSVQPDDVVTTVRGLNLEPATPEGDVSDLLAPPEDDPTDSGFLDDFGDTVGGAVDDVGDFVGSIF